jgi:hypothetical protein
MTGAGDPENVRGAEGNAGDTGRGTSVIVGERGAGIDGKGREPAVEGDTGRGNSAGWGEVGRVKTSRDGGRLNGDCWIAFGCAPLGERGCSGVDASVAREKASARASCVARIDGTSAAET